MRKQVKRGREDQRRGKKEEKTHPAKQTEAVENSFYKKHENNRHKTFYRKYKNRAAKGEIT